MNDGYIQIFNSPIEVGIRVLVLLDRSTNTRHSLQRLCIYDYILLHAGDIDLSQNNIHPLHPYRSSEYPIKHQIIKNAIYLLITRRLINVFVDKYGITYGCNVRTKWFLDFLESEYIKKLKRTAEWIDAKFSESTDEELSILMKQKITKWGDEFNQEVLIGSEGIL
jgi:hypothetical protein